jgi:hypothetical protein
MATLFLAAITFLTFPEKETASPAQTGELVNMKATAKTRHHMNR